MYRDQNSLRPQIEQLSGRRGRVSRLILAVVAAVLLAAAGCGDGDATTTDSSSLATLTTVTPTHESDLSSTTTPNGAAESSSTLVDAGDRAATSVPRHSGDTTATTGRADDASSTTPQKGETHEPATRPTGVSGGCGTPSEHGVIDLTNDQSGRQRQARLYVPRSYDASQPAPLLINLHGLMGFPSQQAAWSGFETMAETEGFLTVAPQGTGLIPLWNAIGYPAAADDVAFLDQLIDDIESNWCVDTDNVFVAGISNGGLMATYLACQDPGRFAAIAVVSGVRFDASCSTSPGVDLLVIYGTADSILPITGGLGPAIQGLIATQPLVEGVPLDEQQQVLEETTAQDVSTTIDDFAQLDRCTGPDESIVGVNDIILHSVYQCERGRLESYIIEGGGHTWPGTELKLGDNLQIDAEQFLGYTTLELPASEIIWDFFSESMST